MYYKKIFVDGTITNKMKVLWNFGQKSDVTRENLMTKISTTLLTSSVFFQDYVL